MKEIPVRKIKKPQKEANFSERFSIRDVRQVLGGNDLFHALHRHDFFFVLALQKGRGTHKIDFTSYDVQDNSIFILRPGQVHQLELKADCTGFLMEFDTTFYNPGDNLSKQRLNKSINKNFCRFEAGGFEKILYALNYIFNEFNAKREGYTELIKANLDIFFIEFMRQSQGPQEIKKTTGSYTQERLEDFLDLLRVRITDLKQVSQYANLLNLSPYQLNAITKAILGKSASELINEQVILEAKRYLLATPNQVKDIADHLGYEDYSYFIRFFKKHTGYSPEAFRKNSP
ncbi:MAG: helix-turn-helix domain-containing protein [Haliscomenobacteraceae bacterium CHB4]|nr:helix-turn-helix domain-containing protein [Haliscomenobacteraceae bacterium CHB4]